MNGEKHYRRLKRKTNNMLSDQEINELYKQLKQQGVIETRKKFARGDYGEKRKKLVTEWLHRQEEKTIE